MRDLVVREAMAAMAADAAERLHELVAEGREIPYEVHEPGDGSPLCRYEPQTELFVHAHSAELRDLDSFGAACAALETGGLAGPYLERMGVGVPADPRKRAELAGVAFLCRIWMDSSDFSLEPERLDAAIGELEIGADVAGGEIEVIVPLRGLQMPIARLDLDNVSIVRADTVDVPAEARNGDGLGGSPWEPAFLAAVRVDEDARDADGDLLEPGPAAVTSFRRMVTTLRLFKAGSVGLGPYAWTRSGGDRWRRISTGAGRQRPGGYRLTDAELGDLLAFARALSVSGTPFERMFGGRPGFPTTLRRSLSRFEAGLERNVVVEALNDHLLALRFLLEGGGPAELGLAMRVAALCAEPAERADVKAVVDRAIGLERELWSGEPGPGTRIVTPAETASGLEELARAILKDAAAGHLGSDLRATADEILLADGLAVGDGVAEQRGGTTEWDLEPIEARDEGEAIEVDADADSAAPIAEEVSELDARINPDERERQHGDVEAEEQLVIERAQEIFGSQDDEGDAPEAAPELVAVRTRLAELEHELDQQHEHGEAAAPASVESEMPERVASSPVLRLIEQTRAEREVRNERVAGLFPRPETTEWTISEIAYDRSRRAKVSPVN
jgi:hypothetical protein